MKSFDSVGFFWLPDLPDRRLAGILRHDAADGTLLRLFATAAEDAADDFLLPETVTHVFGELADDPGPGTRVSLHHCVRTRASLTLAPGISSCELVPSQTFLGDDVIDDEASSTVVRWTLPALHPWWGRYAAKWRRSATGRSLAIEGAASEDFDLGAFRLRILVEWSQSTKRRVTSVTEEAYVEVTVDAPQTIGSLWRACVYPITMWIAFAAGRSQETTSLCYQLPPAPGEPPRLVEALPARAVSIDARDLGYVLTARHIGDNLGETLRRWLAFCAERRRFVELYGTLLEHRHATVEVRLTLWLTALRLYLGLGQHDALPQLDDRIEAAFRSIVGDGQPALTPALVAAEAALWARPARAARAVHKLCLALEWTLRACALAEVGVRLEGLSEHAEGEWIREQLIEAVAPTR